MPAQKYQSALEVPNVRKFIAFRLFFNARFYYPVFAYLFQDFGLSLDQFAVLNTIWAITIVLSEVPSGALADIIGRRRLVIFAAFLMVLEMLVVSVVPPGSSWLFWAFAVNRVLSGLAEAAASGADEALAYDSLKEEGLEMQWPKVLERMMLIMSIGFALTGILGALLYDHTILNKAAGLIGLEWSLSRTDTVRIPLWLTLGMSTLAVSSALGLQELRSEKDRPPFSWHAIGTSFRQILEAGLWILRTPFALIVILGGFVFDSLSRLFATIESLYLGVIKYPEWTFGIIASGLSLMMMFSGKLGNILSTRLSPYMNVILLGGFTLSVFFGLAQAIPYWGLIFAALGFMIMSLTGFFVSHYLNRIVDSRHRATVLSFKSLAMNLAYGAATFLYGLLVSSLRQDISGSGEEMENQVLIAAMEWFPWSFLIIFVALLIFAKIFLKDKSPCFQKG